LYVKLYLTELLTVQCNKQERTLTWTYENGRRTVDSWKLQLRNLTREQNDYDCDKEEVECNGGVFTDYRLQCIYMTGCSLYVHLS